ncbi:caspase family protein [Sphingobium sp. AN641]|uniref:caspase family protein n=1 Tax=Sphingobium sp. AN641 TaxID=3133443 RepID=UPI0030C0489E
MTFVTIALSAACAHAETRALLVGVWQFQSSQIMDLRGPENDLQAMETVIRGQGASDVTVLRNDAVSRTTVETALHALGLRSKPGDWIMLYYSGHGAQAEAAVKGTRDGDLDQFLPLARFDPDVQDAERFIVDKDFYNWIARYVPRGVQVLMMADACHSGTLHRSVDQRAWGFTPRLALRSSAQELKLASRPAPRFPSVLPGGQVPEEVTREDLPNLIYISAAKDDQLALEASLPVEGAPSRGLLTYSFEQGLTMPGPDGRTLAADEDRDGTVTVAELAIYLNGQVRALTGQRQESNAVIPAGKEALGVFAAIAPPPAPPSPPSPPPRPGLYVADAKRRASVTGDYPWRVLTAPTGADFVWDPGKGVMLRRSGDIVAQNVTDRNHVRGVIEKWDAVEALRPYLSENRARLMIGPQSNGVRYPSGAPVTLALRQEMSKQAGDRYATVFNLASDGTVQLLYPDATDGTGKLAPDQSLPILDSQVIAPFGTDHVVALVTRSPPDQFRALLRTVEGQRAAMRLVAPIKALLASGGGEGALSIGELYTGN